MAVDRIRAKPGATRRGHLRTSSASGDDRKSLSSRNVRNAVQRGAAICKSEGDGTRTRNLRIDSPVVESITNAFVDTCDDDKSNDNNRRNNGVSEGDLDALATALAALPDRDRAAVVAHIQALAKMAPEKRAALLMLASADR